MKKIEEIQPIFDVISSQLLEKYKTQNIDIEKLYNLPEFFNLNDKLKDFDQFKQTSIHKKMN